MKKVERGKETSNQQKERSGHLISLLNEQQRCADVWWWPRRRDAAKLRATTRQPRDHPKEARHAGSIDYNNHHEIKTTAKRSEETIRGGKRLIEIEASTLTRQQEKLDVAQNASKRNANNKTITKILTNTEDIKTQLGNRPQPNAVT
jgi:hypothetical protein